MAEQSAALFPGHLEALGSISGNRGKNISSFFTWEKGRSLKEPLNKKSWISSIVNHELWMWPNPTALTSVTGQILSLPELYCVFSGVLSLCCCMFVHLIAPVQWAFPCISWGSPRRGPPAWRWWVMARSRGNREPGWRRCSRMCWAESALAKKQSLRKRQGCPLGMAMRSVGSRVSQAD